MKALKKILILVLMVGIGSAVIAQAPQQSKKAEKLARIKKTIEDKRFVFIADYVLPLRMAARQLDFGYDLKVRPDSVISFLPYFGRAYFGVPYNSSDGGIKFTSTQFDYKVTDRKKGGWEITIKPRDVKYTESAQLIISTDGYASLSVTSTNRDFISFNGYIK